jgi:hypothetical protein
MFSTTLYKAVSVFIPFAVVLHEPRDRMSHFPGNLSGAFLPPSAPSRKRRHRAAACSRIAVVRVQGIAERLAIGAVYPGHSLIPDMTADCRAVFFRAKGYRFNPLRLAV